jgi:23S rRNA pseudoU1915 N3-methylase RlmH
MDKDEKKEIEKVIQAQYRIERLLMDIYAKMIEKPSVSDRIWDILTKGSIIVTIAGAYALIKGIWG